MSLTSEFAQIMQKAELAVNNCLETDIAQIAGECIQFRVEHNVYTAYTPYGKDKYIRRKRNGGIADPLMYSYSVDGGNHTLTVTDNRHEVGVVESGVGYTWEDSRIYGMQPFPRPYFKQAEEDVYSDGEAAAALVRAIQSI